jgi:hypothetical protein
MARADIRHGSISEAVAPVPLGEPLMFKVAGFPQADIEAA